MLEKAGEESEDARFSLLGVGAFGRTYEQFRTDIFPDKKLVVLTCMDTRLVELLPRAMNLRNGDANGARIAVSRYPHFEKKKDTTKKKSKKKKFFLFRFFTGCGIGGDLFAIVWDSKTKKLHGLNASGRSPAGATRPAPCRRNCDRATWCSSRRRPT